jgi:trans-aconitate 2-methyltransferase
MWNPDVYLKFGDERTRPAADLAARIPLEAPRSVIDLGCGPGNSTKVLRGRWPEARVVGLDSSPEMIAKARDSQPEGEWILGGIEDWVPLHAPDLVFSNATLQWLPDHAELVPRLFAAAAPGGVLAFQVPSGADLPIRVIMREISKDPVWDGRMAEARRALTMEKPDLYYDLLAPHADSIDIWETEYCHVMDSAEAIVEWVSGTGLRPYLDALATAAERKRFSERLVEGVEATYAVRADGRILFPFRRLFVVARRKQ